MIECRMHITKNPEDDDDGGGGGVDPIVSPIRFQKKEEKMTVSEEEVL